MIEEAQRIAAIEGHNFPGDEWYERTYALLNDAGVQQVRPGRRGTSRLAVAYVWDGVLSASLLGEGM